MEIWNHGQTACMGNVQTARRYNNCMSNQLLLASLPGPGLSHMHAHVTAQLGLHYDCAHTEQGPAEESRHCHRGAEAEKDVDSQHRVTMQWPCPAHHALQVGHMHQCQVGHMHQWRRPCPAHHTLQVGHAHASMAQGFSSGYKGKGLGASETWYGAFQGAARY